MIRYSTMDKQKNTIINELNYEEYKTCKKFYTKYKLFEDLYHSFLCGNDAVRDYNRLIKTVEEKKMKSDIHKIHKMGIYQVTSMILMLRLFVDNAKSYRKRIGLLESAQAINKVEQKDTMKLLRALRNYAQHFSIPITNTKITHDLLNEKTKLDFVIKKDELLRNKKVESNVETIKKYAKEELYFNDLVDSWEETNKELFMSLLADFTKNIDFKMKTIFSKHMGVFESDGQKYSTSAFVLQEGKYRITKEILVMDPMLIELIGISIKKQK